MKKNNKAFTLIELLAIIVILAIIAVITVPIILNVIENSRRGAAVDSAYGYKDAISKYYVSNMIDNQDISLDGFYLIKDGNLKKGSDLGRNDSNLDNDDLNLVEISFSGTAPSGGSIVINKGSVEAGCMTLDDYKVTILNDTIYATEKGECNGIPVYYDVINGKECYTTSNSDSCMKWYIYDADESTYTMILDHNLKSNYGGQIAVSWNNENGTSTKNYYKPSTLLDALKFFTDGWIGVDERTDGYTPEWIYKSTPYSYSIDYSGYRARLITAQEIADITGASKATTDGGLDWKEKTSTSSFNFGRKSFTVNTPLMNKGSNPFAWLYNNTSGCTEFGCEVADSSAGNNGYWTISPYVGNDSSAWVVLHTGNLSSNTISGSFGFRPVITVSKSKLLSE